MPPSLLSKFFLISLLSATITATNVTQLDSQCLDDQKSLLLELKKELIFISSLSYIPATWNETDDCCSWHGVGCDAAGYVISLQLINAAISGGIGDSSSLFKLKYLEKLNLAFNDLNFITIPRGIQNLSYLTHLNLAYTNFGGQVPLELSSLRRLVSLDISNTFLKGPLPEMIFHLPTLQYLDLSNNQHLSGSIPPFPQQGSLKSLKLSRTNLSGSLPSSIRNLKTLKVIDLSSCKFTGHISSTFANLTELDYLDLSDNFFTGSIPNSLFSHPSLSELWLADNQLTGQIEGFLTENVSNIETIFLSKNRLEGPFPDSLFQLQNLIALYISDNLFNDTFHLEKFLSLPNLEDLDLSYNNLSIDVNKINTSSYGFIPLRTLRLASCNLYGIPEFINHSDITFLDLSSNRIAGELPSWIWGIGTQLRTLNFSSNLLTGMQKPFYIPTSLYILDLSSNRMQGELHLPIPSLSDLYLLSVANNSLSGSIPTFLCNATSLMFLDLSLNKLSGEIPPCLLQNSVNLEVFNLFRNNISGHIPDMFPLNCSLRTLDLHKNILQGKIPNSLESCKSLEFINVGNNIINDTFPCMLSSNLHVLVLHSNRFHGEVRCSQSLPNLQIVDISSNDFSGSLDSINFSSWSAMKVESDPQLTHNHSVSNFLWASASRFYYLPVGVTLTMKGLELNIVKIWPDFIAIDSSCNNFQGEIPLAVANLSSLYLLNLSHNALHGSIPMLFGKLGQLESLDLSQNQLTGRIPVELAGLTFLSFLNLSYNKLIGMIPNGRQFQTFSVDSFKGNPELCGFPLDISCTNTDDNGMHENVDLDREIEWEYVSAALGYVVGLGSIVWLLLFCRSFRDMYFYKIEDVVDEIFDGRNKRRRWARRTVRNHGRRR